VLNGVKGVDAKKDNINRLQGGTYVQSDTAKEFLLMGTCLSY
jgi:hypothetical protein